MVIKWLVDLVLKKRNIINLKNFINKKFSKIEKNLKKSIKFFDLEISPSAVNDNFYNEINSLSPFGSGNPEPKFVVKI